MKRLIIAIDGPVGSGKSSVARRVADLLGYTYLDSGAMYRGVAWKALRDSVPLDSAGKLEDLARATRIDLGACDLQARARHESFVDGVAEFDRSIAPGITHVLKGGEAGLQILERVIESDETGARVVRLLLLKQVNMAID